MSIEDWFGSGQPILMEGALAERLKREYGLVFDEFVAMVGLIYSTKGREALHHLWSEYIGIAARSAPGRSRRDTRKKRILYLTIV